MGNFAIRTQDGTGDWMFRRSLYPWQPLIILQRWRPSLLHRVRAAIRRKVQ